MNPTKNDNYGCFLLTAEGSCWKGKIQNTKTAIYLDNNMLSALEELLKIAVPLGQTDVVKPCGEDSADVWSGGYVRDKLSLHKNMPLCMIDLDAPSLKALPDKCNVICKLITDAVKQSPFVSIDTRMAFLERIKSSRKDVDQCEILRKSISDDFDMEKMEKISDSISEVVFYCCEGNKGKGNRFPKQGKESILMLQKEIGKTIELMYACVLKIALLSPDGHRRDDPDTAMKELLDWMDDVAGYYPVLELCLAFEVFGKTEKGKAALKNRSISDFRNAAWDVAHFRLFQVFARHEKTKTDKTETFFATNDEGLARLAGRFAAITKEKAKEDKEEAITALETSLSGLSFGKDSDRKKRRLIQEMMKMVQQREPQNKTSKMTVDDMREMTKRMEKEFFARMS